MVVNGNDRDGKRKRRTPELEAALLRFPPPC
jgi:hypothetical protein